MKIVLASRNKKKIRELETLLAQSTSMHIEVLSLDDIGYSDEIEEDGTSFSENALIKASVPASLGYIGIADDSGLTVDALGGAPGIYSARYAGENATDAERIEKLLSEMKNVPEEERGAAFVSVIAYVTPEGEEKIFRGECRGRIDTVPRGENGFGYDPVFYIEEYEKTTAQMTPDEKNAISHRGKALRALSAKLKK